MSYMLWVTMANHSAKSSIRKGLSKRRHLIKIEKLCGCPINKKFVRNAYKYVKRTRQLV